MTALTLRASIDPAELPATAPCDVRVRLALVNAGDRALTVSPAVAKLAAIASYAGIGVTWSLAFTRGETSVPMVELRTWYGPPGNPPAPSILKTHATTIAPHGEHVVDVPAAWVPNAALEARHLDVKSLDPQGMDGLAGRVALAGASVLVLGAPWPALSAARTKDDFLRGHVVAFFPGPGDYTFTAAYSEAPWSAPAKTHVHATAAPVALRVG